jgi:hypothetical protein
MARISRADSFGAWVKHSRSSARIVVLSTAPVAARSPIARCTERRTLLLCFVAVALHLNNDPTFFRHGFGFDAPLAAASPDGAVPWAKSGRD